MSGRNPRYQVKHRSAEHHRYEMAPDEPYSVGVVCAVADAMDCDPVELPEVLQTVVDADALDSLLPVANDASTPRMTLSFTYCDCLVTVHADRTIEIREDVTG